MFACMIVVCIYAHTCMYGMCFSLGGVRVFLAIDAIYILACNGI